MPQPPQKQQLQPQQRFHWEQIDHRLVVLKLTDLVIEIGRKTKAEEHRIRLENRGNRNGNAVPTLILAMKERVADEYVGRLYEIYCDVWNTQGNAKSPAFVRGVLNHAVLPSLRVRASSIAHEFSRWVGRNAFLGGIRDAHLRGIDLSMRQLQGHWQRKLEAEAKELEHRERLAAIAAFGHTMVSSMRKTSAAGSRIPDASASSDVGHQRTEIPPGSTASRSTLDVHLNLEAIIRKIRNPQANTILTVPEAALYFSVKPRTIHRWVRKGKLRSGGRRGSITIASVLKWEARRSKLRPAV